jgi:predicted ATPase
LLRISGEHVYTISPLDEADSVQLFVEGARSARADFLMTDGDLAAITAICARVDGLPLAIELAAGRVRLFRPSALLARLERRLPLLSGGPREHAATQALPHVAWCHDLQPAEQPLFQKLAVYAGYRSKAIRLASLRS